MATEPGIAASLRRLQEKAIDNTLADHQLPASDRDAVRSWGRNEAQAELFALVVEAIKTPSAQRTTDQQNAVTWMSELAIGNDRQKGLHAGAEYARWAGLDVNEYSRIADTASLADLTAFLSSPVEPFNTADTAHATGGYCVYKPPAPFSADYDGSLNPMCLIGTCPSVAGCPVATPTFDEFVKWGQVAASYPTLSNGGATLQAAAIAAGAAFGVTAGLAIITGVTIGATAGSAFVGTAAATTLATGMAVDMAAEAPRPPI